jgi:hypothetical protein
MSTTTAVTTATATVSAVTTTATVRADSGGDCGGSGGGDDDVDSGRRRQRSPAEVEGRGSGPIWQLFKIKLMRGPNNMLKESIRNKINRKNNNIIFGRLEGSRNTKREFWACFSEEYKKR